LLWDIVTALVIGAAFLFLLTNGLNDASAVVAAMIGCGAALPLHAIAFAGVWELTGAIFGGSAVAYTVSKMIHVAPGHQLLLLLLVALVAAIAWNIFTWQIGMPSSSTHALIGGLIGAACISAGPGRVAWGWEELLQGQLTGIMKVIAGLILSPAFGFLVAYCMQMIMEGVLKNTPYATSNCWLKRLQWVVVATLAYNHGSNDTQKVMGVVILALVSAGVHTGAGYDIPFWLRLTTGVIIVMGILSGGWSIMKTVGRGIFTLRPIHSFDSLLSSGASLLTATALGAPVSTTHLVVGSITGAGSADEHRMVNWKTGQNIVFAWLVTIPASALLAVLLYAPLWFMVTWLEGPLGV